VYIGARNQTKSEEAIKSLKELTGKEAIFLKLDLADLRAVKGAAEEFSRYSASLYGLWIRSYSLKIAKNTSCISFTIMGMYHFLKPNRLILITVQRCHGTTRRTINSR
jgi:hypothetical protein